jgi:hypothetical protein
MLASDHPLPVKPMVLVLSHTNGFGFILYEWFWSCSFYVNHSSINIEAATVLHLSLCQLYSVDHPWRSNQCFLVLTVSNQWFQSYPVYMIHGSLDEAAKGAIVLYVIFAGRKFVSQTIVLLK